MNKVFSKRVFIISIAAAILFCLLLPTLLFARVGVGVSPAKYDTDVVNGQTLQEMKVWNTGDEPEHIRIIMVGLGQDIEGVPVFNDSKKAVGDVKKFLEVTPQEFDLDAKEERSVTIKVNIPGGRTGGLYAGLLVRAERKRKGRTSGSVSVSSAAQVGALLELALPGERIETGYIEAMMIEEVPTDKALTQGEANLVNEGKKLPFRMNLSPIVVNTGNVHYKPTGFVIVSTDEGKEIGRPTVQPENILPNCKRALRTIWQPGGLLPDGIYNVEAHVYIGGNEHVYKDQFKIVGHHLARRDGKLEGYSPNMVKPDEPFTLNMKVRNTGNIPYKPTIEMKVLDKTGKKVLLKNEDFEIQTTPIAGNETKVFPIKSNGGLAPNKKGEQYPESYKVEVSLSYKAGKQTYQERQLDKLDGDLIAQAGPSFWTTFANFMRANYLWFVLGLVTLIAIFVIYRMRHKIKQYEVSYGGPVSGPDAKGRTRFGRGRKKG
jgi:hypothetical protein